MTMLDRQTGTLSNQESKTITILRTCAMFLIILCHYLSIFNGFGPVSQLFNVGVPIFFIISGFLYGTKDIDNVRKWYRKQFIKIIIPLYTYYFLSGIILLLIGKIGEVSLLDAIKLLLNLQGFCGGKIGSIQTAHLWFISFILLCYLITPLLQKIRPYFSLKRAIVLSIVASILWIVIILNISNFYFISWVPGVISYIFAYYLAAFWKRNEKRVLVWSVSTGLMFLFVAARLVLKHFATGGGVFINHMYDFIVVPFSQCVLAFWIFFTIYYVCLKLSRFCDWFAGVCKVFDVYSYYVYIVHYMFLNGVVAVSLFTGNKLIITRRIVK